jgi:hypothetical protein
VDRLQQLPLALHRPNAPPPLPPATAQALIDVLADLPLHLVAPKEAVDREVGHDAAR